MTFGIVRGRSTGVVSTLADGSYLLSGFLASAHSVARNAMTNTPVYVAMETSVVSRYIRGTFTNDNNRTTYAKPQ